MKVIFIILFYLFAVSVPSFAEDRDDYKVTVVEQGRHGPITFIVTIDSRGRIKDLSVVETSEVKGRKINRNRFRRQFIGRGSQDPIMLREDIDAVTGATISSKAATRAAKKALAVWEGLSMEGKE